MNTGERPQMLLLLITLCLACSRGSYFCEASTVAATGLEWNKLRQLIPGKNIAKNIARVAVTNKRNDIVEGRIPDEQIGLAGEIQDYATGNNALVPQEELKYGFGQSFVFQRFQSPVSIRKALRSVRSPSSFRWFQGKDGRKGYVSSTKLGGDYVLAESEQVAVDCKTVDVLRAYLSGELQARWNAKDCLECHITKHKKNSETSHPGYTCQRSRKSRMQNLWSRKQGDYAITAEENKNNNSKLVREDSYFYLQDLVLKSQRVIHSQTGPMRYQQIIEIDKVGQHNYSVLVRLLKTRKNTRRPNTNRLEGPYNDFNMDLTTTAKKPFESLQVYVGLEQMGSDVKIYAAGVFEVNRKVVPKLIVFDTSGFAGSLAGKGTLWLASHFEKASLKRKQQT